MNRTQKVILIAVALLVAAGAAWAGDYGKKASGNDIVAVASSNDSFDTLVQAIQAAGLVDTLQGHGPFTVFAPTDEAFARLPAGTLESLLADKEKLTAILTYHVVPGKVTASQVMGLNSAKTVQGGELDIDTADGVRINDAKVVQADVEASNGVIHVIDTVLIPRG